MGTACFRPAVVAPTDTNEPNGGTDANGNNSNPNSARGQVEQSLQPQEAGSRRGSRRGLTVDMTPVKGVQAARIEYTPMGDERQVYKYYCPLCMCHFTSIYVSECCKHYVCFACAVQFISAKNTEYAHLREIPSGSLNAACPHCASKPFKLAAVAPDAPVRSYFDSPGGVMPPTWPQSSPLRAGDYEDMKRKMLKFDDPNAQQSAPPSVGHSDVARLPPRAPSRTGSVRSAGGIGVGALPRADVRLAAGDADAPETESVPGSARSGAQSGRRGSNASFFSDESRGALSLPGAIPDAAGNVAPLSVQSPQADQIVALAAPWAEQSPVQVAHPPLADQILDSSPRAPIPSTPQRAAMSAHDMQTPLPVPRPDMDDSESESADQAQPAEPAARTSPRLDVGEMAAREILDAAADAVATDVAAAHIVDNDGSQATAAQDAVDGGAQAAADHAVQEATHLLMEGTA